MRSRDCIGVANRMGVMKEAEQDEHEQKNWSLRKVEDIKIRR